jgi:hypothetical protein
MRYAVLIALLLVSPSADAKVKRSHAERCAFLASQGFFDCRTPRGFVVDHVQPLCLTGPAGDVRSNMQLQTKEDAKVKDRWERKACRTRRP